MAPRLLAPHQLVEADPEHARNELEERRPLAFARLAKVGRERFGALARLVAAPIIFEAQRRRETFLAFVAGHLARERLAGGDRGEHAPFRTRPLEAFDFGIRP